MTWKFEGKCTSFTSYTLFFPLNLFEYKNPSELFTSGELEHIPPDVKSNYGKPHELNKELTRLPCALRLHICPYVSLHLPLLMYTV